MKNYSIYQIVSIQSEIGTQIRSKSWNFYSELYINSSKFNSIALKNNGSWFTKSQSGIYRHELAFIKKSFFIYNIFISKNLQKDSTKQSKLYFVDLAGSQKVGKTNVVGKQLEEAKNINKSLSALGNVINALTSDKKQHIPYRDSKLTRILQQSLGGNSKTTLIINCSICTYNDRQTLSTLRFGDRAKAIKNKPKINQQKNVKQLLILLQIANQTINQLRNKNNKQSSLPIKNQIQQQKQKIEDKQINIEQLYNKINQYEQKQLQHNQCTQQMQYRIKNILLESAQVHQSYELHLSSCTMIWKEIKEFLFQINKYNRRSIIDLQYWFNNMDKTQNNSINYENNNVEDQFILSSTHETKYILQKTLNNFEQYIHYYQEIIEPFLKKIQDKQNKSQKLEVNKKKIMKIAYSQPYLHGKLQEQEDECMKNIQMEKNSTVFTHNCQQFDQPINSSQKNSQEQSLTEFEMFMESLDSKESHKLLFEELNTNNRNLKKENAELLLKCQASEIDINKTRIEIQEKYSEYIQNLQERVVEYKKIINLKDQQIQQFGFQNQNLKKQIHQQKILYEGVKKIIENSTNLRYHYEIQQKYSALQQQRPKLYKQLSKLRDEIDEAQITIKQKNEHIESLKEVLKQISKEYEKQDRNNKETEKIYNNKLQGTNTPNIIKPIQGGNKNDNNSYTYKQSILRNKIPNLQYKKQNKQKKNLPFFKGFFT